MTEMTTWFDRYSDKLILVNYFIPGLRHFAGYVSLVNPSQQRQPSNKIANLDLGYPETIKLLEERLKRCYPSNKEWVGEQLKHAKNGEGPTIYDWLLKIIPEHENVTINLE
ncbi:hypothetical protein O9H85_03635 [Paenibacillus filicis]|uniref:Uncharacterized protein n=1 Tax=Paenibacillus gyeongsangnamensis TaxID=3388067 RepID=A0ABT4Q4C0_9BACL|nr:hypothetical protein [Paenibacillus filicis]MCZ8511540.1 hypothetical protein [Paenibacillus filicis]